MVAPAMNQQMFSSLAMQDNLELLRKRNIKIVEPGYGEQACGDIGEGRLAESSSIAQQAAELFEHNYLAGKRVLITVGATIEAIDPVRFISNHSSGKMGMALASASIQAGADTTIIVGSISIELEKRAKSIHVESANEMYKAVIDNIDKHKYLVPNDISVGQFVYIIRKRVKLTPEKAIFIFINDVLPPTSTLMGDIYNEHKNEDGFLYITYAGENTFGF